MADPTPTPQADPSPTPKRRKPTAYSRRKRRRANPRATTPDALYTKARGKDVVIFSWTMTPAYREQLRALAAHVCKGTPLEDRPFPLAELCRRALAAYAYEHGYAPHPADRPAANLPRFRAGNSPDPYAGKPVWAIPY
jgi:hypothetical protein